MREDIKTPLEMLYHWERETPQPVFLRQPKALQWTENTWAQVGDAVRRVTAFLLAKSYPAGSRIALRSANSKDVVIFESQYRSWVQSRTGPDAVIFE